MCAVLRANLLRVGELQSSFAELSFCAVDSVFCSRRRRFDCPALNYSTTTTTSAHSLSCELRTVNASAVSVCVCLCLLFTGGEHSSSSSRSRTCNNFEKKATRRSNGGSRRKGNPLEKGRQRQFVTVHFTSTFTRSFIHSLGHCAEEHHHHHHRRFTWPADCIFRLLPNTYLSPPSSSSSSST